MRLTDKCIEKVSEDDIDCCFIAPAKILITDIQALINDPDVGQYNQYQDYKDQRDRIMMAKVTMLEDLVDDLKESLPKLPH